MSIKTVWVGYEDYNGRKYLEGVYARKKDVPDMCVEVEKYVRAREVEQNSPESGEHE